MVRRSLALVALIAFCPLASAQVNLAEAPVNGECSRFSVELDLAGKMFISQDGQKQTVRLEAKARHVFAERVLALADNMPSRSARHYEDAVASAVVDVEKVNRALPADRRLIVANRTSEGPFCYSPAGPLTRDELDLVTEHFNPQCLAGLLPGKAVNVNDTWEIAPAAALAAGQFDGLVAHKLVGKLVSVADGKATFSIEGTAEGIENGSKVGLAITATGVFDVAAKRVVSLTWKQKDDRDQGPVSPASQVDVTVTLKREALAQPPKELDDAVLAVLPKAEVPPAMTALRHADPKGAYSLTYPRDWHITGQTDQHLVLRLLDKGEFVAQATVALWKKAEPGKHTPAEDFKKAVNSAPGWTAARVIEDGETTLADGRWLYRIAAEGKMEELAVIQTFHLLAGPGGDQVAVTFAMKPEKAKGFGARDKEFVGAIAFPKR